MSHIDFRRTKGPLTLSAVLKRHQAYWARTGKRAEKLFLTRTQHDEFYRLLQDQVKGGVPEVPVNAKWSGIKIIVK